MINQINTFSNKTLPFFQEKILDSLSDQYKKIAIIALAAITCGVISYAVITKLNKMLSIASEREVSIKKEPLGYCLLYVASFFMSRDPFIKSADKDEVEDDQMKSADINEKLTVGEKKDVETIPFLEAMELMFPDRCLDLGVWLDPMTPEQLNQRHEKLKTVIKLIPNKDINKKITYREGMASREQTLLLQAIMVITDPAHRLEIVKMLLAKGADPRVQGWRCIDVDPMQEAQDLEDKDLSDTLKQGLKKIMMEQETSWRSLIFG